MTIVASKLAVRSGSWIVRAWFDEYMIAQHTGPKPLAVRYAESMTSKFQGLRVTLDPIGAEDGSGVDDIPADSRLWPTSIAPGVAD